MLDPFKDDQADHFAQGVAFFQKARRNMSTEDIVFVVEEKKSLVIVLY